MPSTVTTEHFGKDVTEEQVKAEERVKVEMGASKSWHEKTPDGGWVLYARWPAIGQE